MSEESIAITEGFNIHLIEFIKDLCSIYPEDVDLIRSKNQILNLSNITPKTLIGLWKNYSEKYKEEILQGNVHYFLNKEYSEDVKHLDNSDNKKTLQIIENLRTKFENMSEQNKKKTIQYIQNLTQLALLY